eukprot:3593332-Amphidinium_carterae.1
MRCTCARHWASCSWASLKVTLAAESCSWRVANCCIALVLACVARRACLKDSARRCALGLRDSSMRPMAFCRICNALVASAGSCKACTSCRVFCTRSCSDLSCGIVICSNVDIYACSEAGILGGGLPTQRQGLGSEPAGALCAEGGVAVCCGDP